MKRNKDAFKTLDKFRYFFMNNGLHDWVAECNDVFDRIIELERELQDKKEELEKFKIRIKQ